MGVTFRSGDYIRDVRMGGRTIKDGEAAIVWQRNGEHQVILGPRRIWLFFSTIRFLTRHKAESHQYIVVSHRNGRKEHLQGPMSFFENPVLHHRVQVRNGILLQSENDFVMIHDDGTMHASDTSEDDDDDDDLCRVTDAARDKEEEEEEVKVVLQEAAAAAAAAVAVKTFLPLTRICKGPQNYVPRPTEYVHTFSWSKMDGLSVVPNADCFQVIHTNMVRTMSPTVRIPFYNGFYDVLVQLHIAYEIESLSNKLIKFPDPIRLMHSGLLSDAQYVGSFMKLEDFVCGGSIPPGQEQKQSSMHGILFRHHERDYEYQHGHEHDIEPNLMDHFPSLRKAAKQCGISVISMSLTDWTMGSELLKAVSERQKLEVEYNTQMVAKTKEHELHEYECKRKQAEMEMEVQLKRMEDEMQDEMQKFQLDAIQRKMELALEESKGMVELDRLQNQSVLSFLREIKELGVDMTAFLTSKHGIDASSMIKHAEGIERSRNYKE